LVPTLRGLPIGYALTGAKADERQTLCLTCWLAIRPWSASRPGQILIADKAYFGRGFKAPLAGAGIELLRRVQKVNPNVSG